MNNQEPIAEHFFKTGNWQLRRTCCDGPGNCLICRQKPGKVWIIERHLTEETAKVFEKGWRSHRAIAEPMPKARAALSNAQGEGE